MPNIFTYFDYRQFIKDCCRERQKVNPHFSYRYISQKIGLRSTGFLSMVVAGKRNISDRIIIALCKILSLKKRERSFFTSLVRFNQAETHEEKSHFYQELLSYKESPISTIKQDQYEFYTKWYYSVIRELIAIQQVSDDHQHTAKLLKPQIKPAQVREALEVLSRLELIYKDKEGVYKRCEPVITTGETVRSFEIHLFHKAMLDLAKSALTKIHPDERELSTVTMSINEEAYQQIKEKTAQYRREVMAIARTVNVPDSVYQLNIQIFPVAEKKDKSST